MGDETYLRVKQRWRYMAVVMDKYHAGCTWARAARAHYSRTRGPELARTPAAQITPDQVLDMLRRLVEEGEGRTANKLRAYLRAAYQCAIDVRTTMSIPVTFKAFAVVFNPAAQTKRDPKYDRPDKRPLSADDLSAYWQAIRPLEGIKEVSLRLHLLTGGQRIEQRVRLRREHVQGQTIKILDAKGRPGQGGPRPHMLPLLKVAAADLAELDGKGEFALSTTPRETSQCHDACKMGTSSGGGFDPRFSRRRSYCSRCSPTSPGPKRYLRARPAPADRAARLTQRLLLPRYNDRVALATHS